MLKKLDYLTFGFIIITSILIFFGCESNNLMFLLLFYRFLIVIGIGLLLYVNKKLNNKFLKLIRNIYPIIITGYFYQETVHYNKLLLNNIDPLLFTIENRLFSCQLSLQFSRILPHRIFSEIMYLGYFSFYYFIFGFCIFCFYEIKKFEKPIFLMICSFFLYYLIFAIIPSQGPQYYLNEELTNVPNGYIFAFLVKLLQNIGEQPTGAFPSSHVGITLVILYLSKKYLKSFFNQIIIIAVILIFSTVYIKAHYAIDVIAAIIITPIIIKLSNLIYNITTTE